jgi:hypothetical protein
VPLGEHKVCVLSLGLIALASLSACDDERAAAPPHRLVGIWSSVHDASQLPPSSPSEWEDVLRGDEPSYPQYLFLPDGTHVMGGLFMGHDDALECRWEVVEESPSVVRVKMTMPDGRAAEEPMTIHFDGPDLIRMGPWPPSELVVLLRRTPEIGPFASLAKYRDRL